MLALRDDLSLLFNALADPTRRAIIERLISGEATVLEIARPFTITLPAVSKHLKVLEAAGIIERDRRAQTRPCRIKPDRLKEVADYLDRYRQLWEERFDRLDALLAEMQASTQQIINPKDIR
ncbi:MAG: winged helix-turn-helix transcriptional regulator [Calditrichaeota bacterium]|nr:winged helix-turn-helix transcriptional regulator [Calditrichota bacterium]